VAPVDRVEFPSPLAEFIQACERKCVAGCCGLDAFDFDADYVPYEDPPDPAKFELALRQLAEIEARLRGLPGREFGSDLLNYGAASEDWLEVLAEIRSAIEIARTRLADY
jgi:sugar phosphate isomerase/epimerase